MPNPHVEVMTDRKFMGWERLGLLTTVHTAHVLKAARRNARLDFVKVG